MYVNNRPRMRPTLLVFVIAALLLMACSGQLSDSNWPGLSDDGNLVYMAYGGGVVAVDIVAEQEIWNFPPEEERQGSQLFYAPPDAHDDRVVFGDYGVSGGMFSPGVVVNIYALDGVTDETPELLWDASSLAHDRILARPLWVDDYVFVGTADNRLLAIDANSGELLWEFKAGHSIWAQPTFDNGVVFISSMDRSVYARDVANDELLWRVELGGAVAAKPVLEDGIIYVGSFDGNMHALDADSGNELWSFPAEAWIWGAVVVADETVYFGDMNGNVYALDAGDGTQIWQSAASGPVRAAPVVTDEIVYFASLGTTDAETLAHSGELLALDRTDGTLVWNQLTPERLYETPAIIGNRIAVALLSSDGPQLLVYDLETESQVWSYSPPQ